MANFITDAKKKIQDLFVYIVSCGKSSKEPTRNVQEIVRDAPLGDDLGLVIYIPEEDQAAGPASDAPPSNNAQGQGHIVVVQPGNSTNKGQPTSNIPPVLEDNIDEQGQGLDESSQEQEEPKDDDDIEPLPDGFIPEERANFSRPPGRRSAPIPKTG